MRRRLARLGLALCLPAAVAAQDPAPAGPMASIAGLVFDSLSLRPMAQAIVQLARVTNGRVQGTWSATSDSAGRYQFGGVEPGSYLLGFQHLSIDTLGFRSPVHRVDVRRGGTVRVMLAVPAMQSIVAKTCGEQAARDSLSLLVGSVRHAASDAPVAGAFVSVRWAEVYLTRNGMVRELPTHDLRTDDDGWYMACVPSGIPVSAHAEQEALRSGDVQVVMSTLAVLRRDLYVGAGTATIATAEDSVRRDGVVNEGDRLVLSGHGTVRGVVRRLDGTPVSGARVRVFGGAVEARTGAQGAFTLEGVPQGTHLLEVRALGYLPDETLVDIVGFRETSVQVTLANVDPTRLDTMRVRGSARMAEALKAGFERRRKTATGTFFDESLLDTLKVQSFADILRQVPGVSFVEGRGTNDGFQRQLLISGGGRAAPCAPDIYVDGGLLIAGAADLAELVNPATVRRLEVYPKGTTVPAEFSTRGGCGAIVVWTTPRPPRRPRG